MEESREMTVLEETVETEESAAAVKGSRPRRPGGALRFENDFTITPEVYQEFMKTFTRPYRRVYFTTGGIALLLGLLSFLGASFSSGMMMLIVGVVCFVLPAVQTGGSKKKKYAAQVTKNGGKPLERRVLFYDDGIEAFSNNNAHTVFDYGDITKVISSGSLYALVMEKRLSLLVLKDSFSQGNLAEWKRFMATKGSWKIR